MRGLLRFLTPIWHIRGRVVLAPEQSSEEAFGRLAPLFHQPGTSHDRTGDTLTFRKTGQSAQDKMSIFDRGILRIEQAPAGRVLHYRLTSRALLACFLAPLLFLTFAGATIAIGKLEKPPAVAKDKKKATPPPQHWLDKALGAPAPEKPKDGKDESEDKKPSPTSSYVFAAIFAGLYAFGRILEGRLIKGLLRKSLLDS